ncbi:uncharacterized protein LOC128219283 [Mya arenaria]|uniref:uncharacterized protein LOC128219283 n=1 Tax=Mya arenaria TaxID=6604 RepID=UPI0022E80A30|nr:uncharacterized protein LOC128219283 [Mya arenaria]
MINLRLPFFKGHYGVDIPACPGNFQARAGTWVEPPTFRKLADLWTQVPSTTTQYSNISGSHCHTTSLALSVTLHLWISLSHYISGSHCHTTSLALTVTLHLWFSLSHYISGSHCHTTSLALTVTLHLWLSLSHYISGSHCHTTSLALTVTLHLWLSLSHYISRSAVMIVRCLIVFRKGMKSVSAFHPLSSSNPTRLLEVQAGDQTVLRNRKPQNKKMIKPTFPSNLDKIGLLLKPIKYDTPCKSSIEKHSAANLHSLDEFHSATKELFNPTAYIDPESHGDPVFVTAASSNHFTEVLGLIENMNAVVRRWMPHFTLYIFNLGLNNTELNQIRNVCRCHILRFPFDRFPDHVRVLFGYTFKPLSIQLIAKDHPFLVWMDTSVRFKSVDPRPMFRSCRHQGVVGVKGSGSIARRTLPNTFAYFNKEPCAFRKLPEIQATFIVLTVDRFVSESIIKPWVGCALTPGCMLPQPDPQPYINCFTHGDVYGECHRFDQSVLGILLYANYGSDIYHEQLSDNGPHFCMKRACSSNGIGIRINNMGLRFKNLLGSLNGATN